MITAVWRRGVAALVIFQLLIVPCVVEMFELFRSAETLWPSSAALSLAFAPSKSQSHRSQPKECSDALAVATVRTPEPCER